MSKLKSFKEQIARNRIKFQQRAMQILKNIKKADVDSEYPTTLPSIYQSLFTTHETPMDTTQNDVSCEKSPLKR